MKKVLIASIIILGFGATQALVPASQAQDTVSKTTTEKTEKDWFGKLNMQIDLAQAKVAALRAKIALEVEKSPERAKQALEDAEAGYVKARDAAVKTMSESKAAKQAEKLIDDTIAAKDAVANAPADAKKKIDELVKSTEDQIEEYGQAVLDSDEAQLLQKRYAQLEAEAALLKAKAAEKVDDTGKLATSYLDEAKNWYAKAKDNATEKWHQKLADLSTGIDDAKEVVTHKRGQAADVITNLAEQAADLVRGAKSEEPTK